VEQRQMTDQSCQASLKDIGKQLVYHNNIQILIDFLNKHQL